MLIALDSYYTTQMYWNPRVMVRQLLVNQLIAEQPQYNHHQLIGRRWRRRRHRHRSFIETGMVRWLQLMMMATTVTLHPGAKISRSLLFSRDVPNDADSSQVRGRQSTRQPDHINVVKLLPSLENLQPSV